MLRILTAALSVAFIVFATTFVNASPGGPAIAISPFGNDDRALYPFEVVPYEIVVVNTGQELLEGVQLHVFVDPGLALFVNEKDLTETQILLDPIPPLKSTTQIIYVKALESGAQKFKIGVDYGIDNYTHTTYTVLSVNPNPVKMDVTISKQSLSPGEQGSLVLNMKNGSENNLKDISAELVVPDTIESNSEEFYLAKLEPGLDFSNKIFEFTPKPSVLGKEQVTLRISYSDGVVERTFDKSFVIEIQERLQYLIIIVGIIVALVIASYLLRQQRPGDPPKTIQIKDIKPSEIKRDAEE